MTSYPDPADLYPDVAAMGSLAAALQAAAAEHGLSLGQVVADERQPLYYAGVTSATPLRKDLGVTAGAVERCWVITGWGQGIWLIGGSTQHLTDVARAAQLWRDGVPLRDIEQAVPFVELPRLAEAAEQGPAQVVATQWQLLREAADQAPWPEYRELLDAAYAEPKLRQLYPYTSHWALKFSTTTGYPFSPNAVCVETQNGQFVVRTSWDGVVLGQPTTAEEAVSLVLSRLPSDVGPATAGPYPYGDES
ncbi:DUF6193 family natural product biosynthesis protein [Couchioplanes azureus]|uniref:DUF6193 family natural product biosynthesis protein n=1 Tax=Couchioplanes caeruleus TaxID=56438 RepID=UPI0016703432|nr:DUF6193 family natural product biosynthesis protein [Couchioplanes caeruleus]GGQ87345.1 hypothetical protein GCM10010166_66960 [Couchioplanes caeruleus subsp. azureus]